MIHLLIVIILLLLLQVSEGRIIQSNTISNNNNYNQFISSTSKSSVYGYINSINNNNNMKNIRGGGTNLKQSSLNNNNQIFIKNLFTLWGVLQVFSILGNAIKRILPIAIEPFKNKDMNIYQCTAYLLFSIFMGYAEGYKGFQCKLSPLVVKRASLLYENKSILTFLFSGPYSMGLFNASKKRLKISWGISLGVMGLTFLVKKLPYPYRSIIDGGVVFGLGWGLVSIGCQFIKSIYTGKPPDIDPCLPNKIEKSTKKK